MIRMTLWSYTTLTDATRMPEDETLDRLAYMEEFT